MAKVATLLKTAARRSASLVRNHRSTSRVTSAPFRRKPLFEALEPRLLLSADLLPMAQPVVSQAVAEPVIELTPQQADGPDAIALEPIGPLEGGVRYGHSQGELLFGATPIATRTFSIDLAQGQHISATALLFEPEFGATRFATVLELLTPDGVSQAAVDGFAVSDWQQGVALQSLIAQQDGVHQLRLSVFAVEGQLPSTVSYTLDVAVDALIESEAFAPQADGGDDSLNDAWRALPLPGAARAAVVGRIQGNDTDRYLLQLQAGESIEAELSLNAGTNVYLRLLDAQLRMVAGATPSGPNGDYWSGGQSLQRFVSDEGGTYFLEVWNPDYGGQGVEHDYTVVVARNASLDPDVSDELGGAVQLGAIVNGPPGPMSLEPLSSEMGLAYYEATASGGTVTFDILPIADRSIGDGTGVQPQLNVYDADGIALAVAVAAPPEGQGGWRFTVEASAGARLSIEITSSSDGQFLLRVDGAAGANAAPRVVSTSIDNGLAAAFNPWVSFRLSEQVRADQLGRGKVYDSAGELVGDIPVYMYSNDSSGGGVNLPLGLAAGNYRLVLPEGTFTSLTGQPSPEHQVSFLLDAQRPSLVSLQPSQDGELDAERRFVLEFNEPMARNYWPSATFFGPEGDQIDVQWNYGWSVDNRTLTITVADLPAETRYEMHLPYWALRDIAGNEFDANPQTVSVDGLVVRFTTDQALIELPPLALQEPEAGMVWATGAESSLSADTDVDEFSFEIEAGRTFTAAVSAAAGQLVASLPQLQLAVIDPSGNIFAVEVAAASGRGLAIEGLTAGQGGTWKLRVSSPSGETGAFAVSVVSGAMVQREDVQINGVLQAPNHTRADAERLEDSRIEIAADIDRLASTGRFSPGTDPGTGTPIPDSDYFAFTLAAGESASVVLAIEGEGSASNLRLALFDDSGDLASGTGALLAGAIVALDADRAVLDYTNRSDQSVTLYARARADSDAPYTLVVTRGATFDVGGTGDTLQALGPTGAVIGRVDYGRVASPADGGDVLPSFPYELYDAAGSRWDIDANGQINDGTNDAYDGGLRLSVVDALTGSDLGFYGSDAYTTLDGRQVVLKGFPIDGLTTTRQVFVPADATFARFVDSVTNTGTTERTVVVSVASNLGSDGSTLVVGTSQGGSVYGSGDRWVVTDDSSDGGGDPTMVHVLWGEGGQAPSDAFRSGDNLTQRWTLRIEPGQTVSLMHFAAQAGNRAAAMALAQQIDSFDLDLLAGLSTAELSSITNFQLRGGDTYTFRALAGDAVSFGVEALADMSLPYQLRVWAPDGTLTADTGMASGPLSGVSSGFTAAQDGIYRIEVLTSSGEGTYLLRVDGHTGEEPAPQVVTSWPARDGAVASVPPYIDLTFDRFIRSDTVQASDLVLDDEAIAAGGRVLRVETISGQVMRFYLSAFDVGTVGWSLPEGSVESFDGQGNAAANGRFYIDAIAPRAESSAPAGSVEVLTRIDVVFSEAMAPGSVSLDDVVSFTGPAGQDLRWIIQSISVADNVVSVFVAAQSAGGQYRLTLGPSVTDLAGNPMDQDGDGTSGESGEDAFTAVVLVQGRDLRPVDVTVPVSITLGEAVTVSWRVENAGVLPIAANSSWNDRVELVNATTGATVYSTTRLQTQPLELTTGASYTVAAFTFTPPVSAEIPAGDYRVRVVVDSTNVMRESNESNNFLSSTAVRVSVPPTPDLIASAPQVVGTAAANTSVIITWTTTNQGTVDVTTPMGESLVLVDAFGNSYTTLATPFYDGSLAAGASVARSAEVMLPPWVQPGNYRVRVVADAWNSVVEHLGEANNASALSAPIAITAAVYPDLSNVRFTSTIPATLTAGTTLAFAYAVDNAGPGGTFSSTWTDRVTVALADQPNVHLLTTYVANSLGTNLPAGSSYERNVSLALPILATLPQGDYVLRVDTDIYGELAETDRADNGLAVAFALDVPPLGNLVVEAVSSPENAYAGTQIDVTWTVANQGDGDLINRYGVNYFHDRLMLVNAAGAVIANLGDFVVDMTLAAGAEVTRTQRVTLPQTLTNGTYFVAVRTDVNNYINEHVGENDNYTVATAAIAVTQPPRVDLQVGTLQLPTTATSGSAMTVQWRTSNGGAAAFTGSFNETVQISTSANFSANVRNVGTLTFSGSLAVGASAARSLDVQLPIDAVGAWYVRVITDSGSNVFEYDRENNNTVTSTTAVQLSLPPLPDLAVTDIVAPASSPFGATVQVQWTVANQGTAASSAWNDRLQLVTTNGTYDLVTVRYDGEPLGAGQSVTRSAQVVLPTGVTGDAFVRVTTDSAGEILEYPNEGNNTTLDVQALRLTVPPLPNLRVTATVMPAETISGQEIPVTWTITNDGTAAASGTWYDRLWLSSDRAPGNDTYIGDFTFEGTLAAGQSITRTQSYTLPLEMAGDRYLIVEADLGGQIYEFSGDADNTFVADTPTRVVQAPLANLVVSTVTPPGQAFSGQSTEVSWTVTNSGLGSTTTPVWYDLVYLSIDGVLDASDLLVGSAANPAYLMAGQSYSNSVRIALPQDYVGQYRVLVVGDAYQYQYEGSQEGDNTTASAIFNITLTPPPDLVVTDVTAPPAMLSGNSATVSWTVANQGTGRTAESGWYDQLWLSTDTAIGTGDVLLASMWRSGALDADDDYTVSANVTLPIGIEGPYHFVARTDAGNQVYEHAGESNNVGSTDVTSQIALAPPPDLELTVGTLPTSVRSGTTLTFDYEVVNYGDVTPNWGWSDRFWLSLDTVIDANDIRVGNAYRSGQLAADGSYGATVNFTLPPSMASGQYYLIGKADSGDTVFELDRANNVVVSSQRINVEQRPADLVVSALAVPPEARSGHSVVVDYTVTNQATDATLAGYWTDHVVLSTDDVLGNADDRAIASFTQNANLGAGQSYSRSEVVNLPIEFAGAVHLFIRTDAGGREFEGGNEGNNSAVATLQLRRETADLVAELTGTLPAEAAAGTAVTVAYRVTNEGISATNANYWYDTVYLSRDDTLGAGDVQVGQVRRSAALAAGESYDASVAVTLPPVLGTGTWRLIVRADSNGQVIEDGGEGNNTTTPVTLVVTPYVPAASGGSGNVAELYDANLIVATVDAPVEGTAGQLIDVSWTVRNSGTTVTPGTSWYDTVYLSRDPFLDNADIALGSVWRNGALAAGESYTGTSAFRVPPGVAGPMYVFVRADSSRSITEAGTGAELDNTGYDGGLLNLQLAPPADLVVGAIELPVNASPGSNASVSYTVSNEGANAASGSWTDRIYLSVDDQWDAGDVLFASTTVYENLQPGGSYSRTLTAPLPGVLPGTYRVIVRSDILNNLPESSEANNLRASLDNVAVDVQQLGVPGEAQTTLSANQSAWYKVVVPAGETIRLHLDGVDGQQNELYVRAGAVPTTGQFDAVGGEAFSADQTLVIGSETGGTYYVMVRGGAGSAGGAVRLSAEMLPFSVTRVSQTQAGTQGNFTVAIEGARFLPSTAFRLVMGDAVIDAFRVSFGDTGHVIASFDLLDVPAGDWTLQAVAANGEIASLATPIRVSAGEGSEIISSIVGPAQVRPNRLVLATLNYANTGDNDSVAPLFIVTSETGTPIGVDSTSLSTLPLMLLGTAHDGPQGVLRPGAAESIPLVFSTVTNPVRFNVRTVAASNDSALDLELVERSLRPTDPAQLAGWTARWEQIAARLPSTWGGFVKLVGELSLARSQAGQPVSDVRALFTGLFAEDPSYRVTSNVSGRLVGLDAAQQVGGLEVVLFRTDENGRTVREATAVVADDGTFTFFNLVRGERVLAIEGWNFDLDGDGEAIDGPKILTVVAGQDLLIGDVVGAPETIDNTVTQSLPSLTTDSQGTTHAVWVRNGFVMHAQLVNGDWVDMQPVSLDSGRDAHIVRSIVEIEGVATEVLVVVWAQGNGNQSELWYSVGGISASGAVTWSLPVRATTDAYADMFQSATVVPDGTVLLVTQKRDLLLSDDGELYFVHLNAASIAAAIPEMSSAAMLPAGEIEVLGGSVQALKKFTLWGKEFAAGIALSDLPWSLDGCRVTLSGGVAAEVKVGSTTVRNPGATTTIDDQLSGSASFSSTWHADKDNPDWVFDYAKLNLKVAGGFTWKGFFYDTLKSIPHPATRAAAVFYEKAISWAYKWSKGSIQIMDAMGVSGEFDWKDIKWTGSIDGLPDEWGSLAVKLQLEPAFYAISKSFELKLTGLLSANADVLPSPNVTSIKGGVAAELSTKWFTLKADFDTDVLSEAFAAGDLEALDALLTDDLFADAEWEFVGDSLKGITLTHGAGAIEADAASDLGAEATAGTLALANGHTLTWWVEDFMSASGPQTRIVSSEFDGTSWSMPVAIPGAAGLIGEASIAQDASGRLVAVWSQAESPTVESVDDIDVFQAALGSRDVYWSANDGSGWSDAAMLADADGGAGALFVALDDDGLMAGWVDVTDSGDTLRTSLLRGTTWDAPVTLATAASIVDVIAQRIGNQVAVFWQLPIEGKSTGYTTVQWALHANGAFAATAAFDPSLGLAGLAAVVAAGGGDLEALGLESILRPLLPPVPEECKEKEPEEEEEQEEDDDEEEDDNDDTYEPEVIVPRDPNDILGPVGFGEERWITADGTIGYRIRFENAADAAAPAQQVVITQQFDPDLDYRTFRVDDFGFGELNFELSADRPSYSQRLDLRETLGLYVDVSMLVDTRTGIATWTLTSIDPDTGDLPADALRGFLPPNDANGSGEGYVSYTIRAKRDVPTGAVVDATATIVFDTEAPIETPPIFNTLDAGAPQSAVAALPATSDETAFTVHWTGADIGDGSALRDYRVYAQVDDGAWQLWLDWTTETEAQFNGEEGRRYAFYSVARDNAGNVEAAPATADTTIRVLAQTGRIGGSVFNDIDGDGLKEDGEGAVQGWTVFVDADADSVLDADEAFTTSAADGTWQLIDLQPGTWRVMLQPQAHHAVTTPTAGYFSVELAAGDLDEGFAFGVLELGSISGTQFEDVDGDGVFDPSESGVAGWTMFLDTDTDGVLDEGERWTVSADDGSYRFDDLRPGSYRVAQLAREGWIQTSPGTSGSASTAFAVTLSGSLAAISLPACACGTVMTVQEAQQQSGWDEQLVGLNNLRSDPRFAGIDGSGVRIVVIDTGIDRSHPFFDGRIVYQYDFANDDADATDRNGHGTHVAGVIAGADASFGGVAPGAELIVLKVFGDNGSASFRSLERALQWVLSNADAYDIGVVNMSLGDGGAWDTAVSRYGLGDEFAALAARGIINVAAAGNNYAQTNALGVAYPSSDPAVLSIGAVWTGDFGGPWRFGNGGIDYATGADHIASFSQRDDELLDAFAPGSRLTSAAIGGGVRAMQGTSQSAAYVSGVAALAQQLAREHLDRNLSVGEFRDLLVQTATWVTDGDDENENVTNTGLKLPRIDAARLAEAILTLAAADPSTGQPGSGAPGGGSEPAPRPASSGGHIDVTVGAGEQAGGVNFGGFRLGSLGGVVFDDRNANGQQDDGEGGIAGADLFVDIDGDGVVEEGEIRFVTDAQGRWTLGDLGPGAVSVRALVPAGWQATAAGDGHRVTVTSGVTDTALGFGLRDRPPVAADDIASVVEGRSVIGNVLDNDSDPGRDDRSALVVTLLEGTAQGTLVLDADGSFRYTPAAGYVGSDTFRYRVSDGVSSAEAEVRLTVLHDLLRVERVSGRHDGFEVVFTRPIATAGLDMGGSSGDFVVTDASGRVVAGSLFVAADGRSARFLASGSLLADGVYAVKLVSGVDALRDATGIALDGDADGTAGGNWLGSFTVARGNAVSVGLADIARGPGQALGSGIGNGGLALRLSNGAGVTSVNFVLAYDPALLGVATLARGSALPAGATFSATQTAPGRVSVSIAFTAPLAAGAIDLALLTATVPSGATYGQAQLLDVQDLRVNAGAVAALDDDAVHVAAFAGDINADRAHTAADATLMNQLLSGAAVGSPAWPLIDARIVGDANGSGSFDAMDPLRLGQALGGIPGLIVPLPGAPAPAPVVTVPAPKPPVVVVPVRPVTPVPLPVVPKPVAVIKPAASWVAPLVTVSATVDANAAIRVRV